MAGRPTAGRGRLSPLLQVAVFSVLVTALQPIPTARCGSVTLAGARASAAIHLRTETEVFRASRSQACPCHRLMLTRAARSEQWEWRQTRTEISGSVATATTACMYSGTEIRTSRWASNNIREASRSISDSPQTGQLG